MLLHQCFSDLGWPSEPSKSPMEEQEVRTLKSSKFRSPTLARGPLFRSALSPCSGFQTESITTTNTPPDSKSLNTRSLCQCRGCSVWANSGALPLSIPCFKQAQGLLASHLNEQPSRLCVGSLQPGSSAFVTLCASEFAIERRRRHNSPYKPKSPNFDTPRHKPWCTPNKNI